MIIVLLPIVLTVVVVLLTARSLRASSRPSRPEHTRVADLNRDHYPFGVRFTLSGMDSEDAARRVQDRLNRLEGVWAEGADWSAGELHVLCKEQPDLSALRQAVADTGCTVLRASKDAKYA